MHLYVNCCPNPNLQIYIAKGDQQVKWLAALITKICAKEHKGPIKRCTSILYESKKLKPTSKLNTILQNGSLIVPLYNEDYEEGGSDLSIAVTQILRGVKLRQYDSTWNPCLGVWENKSNETHNTPPKEIPFTTLSPSTEEAKRLIWIARKVNIVCDLWGKLRKNEVTKLTCENLDHLCTGPLSSIDRFQFSWKKTVKPKYSLFNFITLQYKKKWQPIKIPLKETDSSYYIDIICPPGTAKFVLVTEAVKNKFDNQEDLYLDEITADLPIINNILSLDQLLALESNIEECPSFKLRKKELVKLWKQINWKNIPFTVSPILGRKLHNIFLPVYEQFSHIWETFSCLHDKHITLGDVKYWYIHSKLWQKNKNALPWSLVWDTLCNMVLTGSRDNLVARLSTKGWLNEELTKLNLIEVFINCAASLTNSDESYSNNINNDSDSLDLVFQEHLINGWIQEELLLDRQLAELSFSLTSYHVNEILSLTGDIRNSYQKGCVSSSLENGEYVYPAEAISQTVTNASLFQLLCKNATDRITILQQENLQQLINKSNTHQPKANKWTDSDTAIKKDRVFKNETAIESPVREKNLPKTNTASKILVENKKRSTSTRKTKILTVKPSKSQSSFPPVIQNGRTPVRASQYSKSVLNAVNDATIRKHTSQVWQDQYKKLDPHIAAKGFSSLTTPLQCKVSKGMLSITRNQDALEQIKGDMKNKSFSLEKKRLNNSVRRYGLSNIIEKKKSSTSNNFNFASSDNIDFQNHTDQSFESDNQQEINTSKKNQDEQNYLPSGYESTNSMVINMLEEKLISRSEDYSVFTDTDVSLNMGMERINQESCVTIEKYLAQCNINFALTVIRKGKEIIRNGFIAKDVSSIIDIDKIIESVYSIHRDALPYIAESSTERQTTDQIVMPTNFSLNSQQVGISNKTNDFIRGMGNCQLKSYPKIGLYYFEYFHILLLITANILSYIEEIWNEELFKTIFEALLRSVTLFAAVLTDPK